MGPLGYLIAIIVFVIVGNFFLLFKRHKGDRKPSKKPALSESAASRIRDREIQRRIDREQEDAARRVDLRNKTFELYEQVRKNAANKD